MRVYMCVYKQYIYIYTYTYIHLGPRPRGRGAARPPAGEEGAEVVLPAVLLAAVCRSMTC